LAVLFLTLTLTKLKGEWAGARGNYSATFAVGFLLSLYFQVVLGYNSQSAVSMAIVTLLLAVYVGNVKLSQAPVDLLLKGTKTVFMVFTVICFVGIFASLARGKNSSQTGKSNLPG